MAESGQVVIPGEDAFVAVEVAANSGALGDNNLPEPTEAEKIANDYEVGQITLHGMDIAIEQPRGSVRSGTNKKTGVSWSNRMAAHYGYLNGTTGADGDGVDVFIGPTPESQAAFIINQNDPDTGAFDEHKCCIGFLTAEDAAIAYNNSYDADWKGLGSMVPSTVEQLKSWLKTGDTTIELKQEALPMEGYEKMDPVTWTEDAPDVGTIDTVLYNIRRHDRDNLLLDAVGDRDIMEDADETYTLDAMVTPFGKLPRKMAQLQIVMERAGTEVKPVAVQITKPFRQRSMVNVAVIFELSDGQTITAFFHNPDLTPARIKSSDELVSWKWMLNKKDITIVAAPEHGTDLTVREVSRRLMRLAAKNSPAFQRANVNRAARLKSIDVLRETVKEKEVLLSRLQKDLATKKIEQEDKIAAVVVATSAAVEPEVVDHFENRADGVESMVTKTATGYIVTMIDTDAGEQLGIVFKYSHDQHGLAVVKAREIINIKEPVAADVPPHAPSDPLPDPIAEAVAVGAADPELTSAEVLTEPQPVEPVVVAGESGLPEGWAEATPGGMATNKDPVWGGIVDTEIATGMWFAIPQADGIDSMDGFATRAEAFAALAAAVSAKIASDAVEEAANADPAPSEAVGVPVAEVQPELVGLMDDALQTKIMRLAQLSGKSVEEVRAAYDLALEKLGAEAALDLFEKTLADYEIKAAVAVVVPDPEIALPVEVVPPVEATDPLPEPPEGTAVPIEMQSNEPAAHLGENPPPVEEAPITDPMVAAAVAGAVSVDIIAGTEMAAAPDAEDGTQRAEDISMFQSVIDGQVDIMDGNLAGNLEAAYGRIQDDADLVEQWKKAISAYTAAMMSAASAKLGGA